MAREDKLTIIFAYVCAATLFVVAIYCFGRAGYWYDLHRYYVAVVSFLVGLVFGFISGTAVCFALFVQKECLKEKLQRGGR